jgi:hypothetical protein
MKYLKFSFMALIAMGLISLTAVTSNVFSQTQSTALERGYRTGYSDGYNAGYRDVADHAPRDYQSKDEYQRADRTYNQVWGTLEDYKDGYQQGFEAGYPTGYDRGNFNSSIPSGLGRRGTVDSAPDNTADNNQSTTNTSNSAPVNNGPVFISRDSMLVIELQSSISTEVSQQGDPFQARVTSPSEFSGAIVEGRVSRVKRAGKVKGSSQLQLSFDTIRMPDGRTSPFNATVVEILDTGGSSDSGTVDSEGGVKGRSSTKDDVSKVGASAGVGAIIGAIFGGGQGAAIGAAIGGSVGTAGVLTSRGKELSLERGQQLKIRTGNEVRIQ